MNFGNLSAARQNKAAFLSKRSNLLMLAVVPVAAMAARQAAATTYTWTGSSSGSWATAANWSPSAVPVAGDTLIFTGSSNLNTTDDLAAGTLINGITFDGSAGNFTLGGTNGITLGVQPYTGAFDNTYAFSSAWYNALVNNASGLQTVTTPITLSALSGTAATGGQHIIAGGTGGIALNGTFTRSFSSTVDFTGNVTTTTLANNAAGILGGWATYNQTDFAANNAGVISAYTGYVNVNGGGTITSNPTSVVKWTSNTAGNISLAVTTGITDINSLNIAGNPTSGAATLTIPSGTELRLGTVGTILRSDATASNTIPNFTIGSTGSLLSAGGNVTGTPGELILNVNNTTSNVTNQQSIDSLTINSNIVDNGTGGTVTLVKTGIGSLKLAGNNTFTGNIYINEGTIRDGANGFSTGNGTMYVADGSQAYVVTNPAGNTIFNPIFIAGVGRQEALAANTFVGGAIRIATAGSTWAGPITMTADARITARGNSGAGGIITGQISGAYKLELNGAGSGNLTISNTANNWSGGLIIGSSITKLGASEVIPNGAGKGDVFFDTDGTAPSGGGQGTNSTLDLNGFNETINGLTTTGSFVGGATGVITNTGTGNATLTVGDNNASGSFIGNFVDTAAKTVGFTKIGTGTETFNLAANYHGNTTITGGTLQLSGAAALNNSSHIIIGPAGTLDGSPFLSPGQVLINNGGNVTGSIDATTGSALSGTQFGSNATLDGGAISPGASEAVGVVGTTAFGDLLINSGFENVDATGAGDKFTAGNLSINSLTINVNANPTPGTYTIISAAALTGANNVSLATTNLGGITFSLNTSTANTIKLIVTGATLNLTWNNSGASGDGATWDTSQLNWKNGATNAAYVDGANVNFTDSNNGHYTVNISGTVSPGNMTVNNSAGDYVINGSIGGTAVLTKSGTSALTLNGSNSYSGGTTLNAGTLNLGNGSALGSGNVTINGGTVDNTSGSPITISTSASTVNLIIGGNFTYGGTSGLTFNNSTAGALTANSTITVNGTGNSNGLEIDAPIIGSGFGITKNGTGTLTLGGNNTFTGGVVLNNGNLNINAAGALGTGVFTINGGTIDNTTGAAVSVTNSAIFAGNFTYNATQGLTMGVFDGPQTYTLTSNVTIGVNNTTKASGLQLFGVISGNFGITKTGTGVLTLFNPDTVSSTFTGGVTINQGFVLGELAGSLGTGTVTVNTGGTFVFGDQFTNPFVFAGGTIGSDDGGGISGNITVQAGTTTTVMNAYPLTTTTAENISFTGVLSGSGNIALKNTTATGNLSNPDASQALRINTSNLSTFSGTIILPNNTKGEIFPTAAGADSTIGTGTFIITAGDANRANTLTTVTTTGGYSELNIRNNFGNLSLPNNFIVQGTGLAIINTLGTAPAGSVATLASLSISDGQEVAIGDNSGAIHAIAFSAVTLHGGNSTLSARPFGFGATTAVGGDLILGDVGEAVAGSNLITNGSGNRLLVLAGNDTFTGSLNIMSGTVQVGSAGAFPAATHTSISFGNATQGTSGVLDLNGFTATVGALNINAGANAATQIIASSSTTAPSTLVTTDTSNFTGTIQDSFSYTNMAGTLVTGNQTVSVLVANGGNLTLSGTNTFSGSAGAQVGGILNIPSTSSLSSAVTVANNGTVNFAQASQSVAALSSTSPGVLNLSGTALTITGSGVSAGGIAGTGTVTVASTGNQTVGPVNVPSLTVNGKLAFTNTTIRTLSKVSSLTVAGSPGAWTGGIDLTNSRLIVEDTTNKAADLISYKNMVANTSGNTVGIYSSTAAADPTNLAVVVSDNAVRMATFSQGSTNFGTGVNNVDANSILITTTFKGDFNLDGVVDLKDLQDIANHWQQTVTDWSQGDVDGNGKVELQDLQAVANHWQAGVGAPGAGSGESFSEALSLVGGLGGSGSSPVPEPASLALIGLGGVVLATRRKRSN